MNTEAQHDLCNLSESNLTNALTTCNDITTDQFDSSKNVEEIQNTSHLGDECDSDTINTQNNVSDYKDESTSEQIEIIETQSTPTVEEVGVHNEYKINNDDGKTNEVIKANESHETNCSDNVSEDTSTNDNTTKIENNALSSLKQDQQDEMCVANSNENAKANSNDNVSSLIVQVKNEEFKSETELGETSRKVVSNDQDREDYDDHPAKRRRLDVPVSNELVCPEVQKTSLIMDFLETEKLMRKWEAMEEDKWLKLVKLSTSDSEYVKASNLFRAATHSYPIVSVLRVQNPYLLSHFLIEKNMMEFQQIKDNNYQKVEVRWLFHASTKKNIKSIMVNNFNWRLFGTSRGSKFGKGVSFSPSSYYATHYTRDSDELNEMLLCEVLVRKSILGDCNMSIPPNADSSHNAKQDVIVKYNDAAFYPTYKIVYKKKIVVQSYDSDDDFYMYYETDDDDDGF